MTTAIAIHKLRLSDPNAQLTHTGAFDKAGNAILKKCSRVVQPGHFFETDDDASLAELVEMGAARLPTPDEIAERDRAGQEN